MSDPIENLIQQGRLAGYLAPDLAEVVGLSLDLLLRLQERAITPESIPSILIERLAAALQVAPEVICAYLARPRSALPFLCGDQPSRPHPQQSFLTAVHASPLLTVVNKQEWQVLAIPEGGATSSALRSAS